MTVDNRGKIEIIFNKDMNFPNYLPNLINNGQILSNDPETRNLSEIKSIIEVEIIPVHDET